MTQAFLLQFAQTYHDQSLDQDTSSVKLPPMCDVLKLHPAHIQKDFDKSFDDTK